MPKIFSRENNLLAGCALDILNNGKISPVRRHNLAGISSWRCEGICPVLSFSPIDSPRNLTIIPFYARIALPTGEHSVVLFPQSAGGGMFYRQKKIVLYPFDLIQKLLL